jgi:class 3 adenylate cyclase
MPIFLDRHDLEATAAEVAEAHRKDLELQERYGVRFLTYWFDHHRHTAFCLIDSPDAETASRVHREAHGNVATEVIPVSISAVEAFLGRIADPAPSGAGAPPAMDAAFRAVMFTDIVDSTAMTLRLGDERAVEMVRAHDAIVRRALRDHRGREIKHTGDGIMASFDEVAAAVQCARAIQQGLQAFNRDSSDQLRVRIGINAGEPVEDSNDLFGATVNLAARICQSAEPDAIVISAAVRELLAGGDACADLGERPLKGIAAPVHVYEVAWR